MCAAKKNEFLIKMDINKHPRKTLTLFGPKENEESHFQSMDKILSSNALRKKE